MLKKIHIIASLDEVLYAKFGKVGTPERDEHRRKAYLFYMGQIIADVRKAEKLTQAELAERVGMIKPIFRVSKRV